MMPNSIYEVLWSLVCLVNLLGTSYAVAGVWRLKHALGHQHAPTPPAPGNGRPPFPPLAAAGLALACLALPGSTQGAGLFGDDAYTTTRMDSRGGTPSSGVLNGNGGYTPADMSTGSFSSQGCTVKLSGGNMGNGSYTGANFLMACDTQDTSGRFFLLWNNDNATLPKTLFEIRRNGYTYANGLSIQQTQTYNQPVYYTPGQFNYGGGNIGWAALNVTSDVPSTALPVLGIFGMQSQYGSTYPPLIRAYGQTSYSSGTGYTSGTEVWSLADNGHVHLGGTGASGTLSVSICGTGSPTIAGADSAFVITLGTGTPTACTVTFKQTWTSTDLTCLFISETDSVNWKFAKVGSASAWTGITLTASAALTNASKIHGTCIGHV